MHLFTSPAHYLKNGNNTTCLIIKNWCVEILLFKDMHMSV